MAQYVPASRLSQTFPDTSGAVTAFTASYITEITNIVVANTSGTGRTFRIFHDDTGQNYSTTTSLFYDVSIGPNVTYFINADVQGSGITVNQGGTIGVRASVASTLNFTLYGIPREGR